MKYSIQGFFAWNHGTDNYEGGIESQQRLPQNHYLVMAEAGLLIHWFCYNVSQLD